MAKKKGKKINITGKKEKKTHEKTMTPSVWTPFDIMGSMDRLFWEDPWMPFWRRRWGSVIPRNPWFEQQIDPDWKQTVVDLVDTGKEFKVVAEMPGVLKKDIEVSITQNNISICGETKTETESDDEGYVRRERSYSTLCRTMTFPEEVNPDKAEATLKDGILEVKVTKRTPTTGKRKILIK